MELLAARYHLWSHLAHTPRPGFTTSVKILETDRGWIITDLCVSMSTDELLEPEQSGPRFWGGMFEQGLNEAGVTARLMHDLRFSEIWSHLRMEGEAVSEEGFAGPEGWRLEMALAKLGTSPRREVIRRRTDLHKAELAAAYVEITTNRDPQFASLYEQLAEDRNLAQSTLKTYLKDLRTEGYLTPSPARGKAGGQLTEMSKRLLRENHSEPDS